MVCKVYLTNVSCETLEIAYCVHDSVILMMYDQWPMSRASTHSAIFSQELMKYQKRDNWCWKLKIAFKFDGPHGSNATETVVKFQSDCKSLHPNGVTSKLTISCAKTSFWLTNEGPSTNKQYTIIKKNNIQCTDAHLPRNPSVFFLYMCPFHVRHLFKSYS